MNWAVSSCVACMPSFKWLPYAEPPISNFSNSTFGVSFCSCQKICSLCQVESSRFFFSLFLSVCFRSVHHGIHWMHTTSHRGIGIGHWHMCVRIVDFLFFDLFIHFVCNVFLVVQTIVNVIVHAVDICSFALCPEFSCVHVQYYTEYLYLWIRILGIHIQCMGIRHTARCACKPFLFGAEANVRIYEHTRTHSHSRA